MAWPQKMAGGLKAGPLGKNNLLRQRKVLMATELEGGGGGGKGKH